MQVLEDFASTSSDNFESHAVKTLRIIEAALEGRLDADIQSYQINGRAINKIPVEELHRLRNKYRAEVRVERTGSMTIPVRVRFSGV